MMDKIEDFHKLMAMIRSKDTLGVVLLLESHKDSGICVVHLEDVLFETPISEAIDHYAGDVTIIKALIDAGANTSNFCYDMYTPLMKAASVGELQIVDMILRQEVSVNEQNYDGDTALDIAIRHNHEDVVDLLLLHKAERGH